VKARLDDLEEGRPGKEDRAQRVRWSMKIKTIALSLATSVVAGLLTAGCTSSQPSSHSSSHSSNQLPPLAIGGATRGAARDVRFGAWQPGGQQQFRALEQRLGRRLDIEHWYYGWGEDAPYRNFDLARAEAATRRGTIPMVTWEPWDYRLGRNQPSYSLRNIIQGKFDAYIRENAQAMEEVHGPVWLRFAHEMNSPTYPWSVGVNGNTGEQYVEAWRRVVRIFRSQGATNVKFVWAPNSPSPTDPPMRTLYPGDKWVDYAAFDSYNWGGSRWTSPRATLDWVYRQVRAVSKRPVIITETGSASSGGSKARWIRALGPTLIRHLPAVRGLVWFNEDKDRDWRLDSSPASLAAARETFTRAPFR
jgi:hypothetical protein